jgi:hypothetical protein
MSAKFRCLAKDIEMWFDDGLSGSYQGRLQLGQESTINTYEGHVFYFTNAKNKSQEYARYTMSKDQVFVLKNKIKA